MHASVNGLAVFLDLFAIKELAKGIRIGERASSQLSIVGLR